jgi:hypothetical protein
MAGALAGVALALAAMAAAVPFMEHPPGGVAGAVAALVIAAEIFAAAAILIVGKELYAKIWAKLQAMRTENAP